MGPLFLFFSLVYFSRKNIPFLLDLIVFFFFFFFLKKKSFFFSFFLYSFQICFIAEISVEV